MADIRLSYHSDSPSLSGGYWYAVAVIDDSAHSDASGVTVEAALSALAKVLAEHIEDTEPTHNQDGQA